MSEAAVFRSLNGRPEENLQKVLELAGGIERFIGADDIVVIKPNVQWWNQGAPNILALKTFGRHHHGPARRFHGRGDRCRKLPSRPDALAIGSFRMETGLRAQLRSAGHTQLQ